MTPNTRSMVSALLEAMSKEDLVEVSSMVKTAFEQRVRDELSRLRVGQACNVRVNGRVVRAQIVSINQKTCTVEGPQGTRYNLPPSAIHPVV